MEKVNLPTLDTYHPLVRSVAELKWQVGEQAAFSKWDVLCGLENAIPEARSQNTKASSEDVVTPPTTADIEGVETQLATTQETDNTILAEPIASSAETNLPAVAEVLPQNEVMVPATEMDNGRPASPAMTENWIIPTTRPGDKPVSPTPSDWVRREKPYTLMVTTSIGILNLEATGVTPSNTIITSVWRMAAGNLCMVATLPGLSPEGGGATKAWLQMNWLKGT